MSDPTPPDPTPPDPTPPDPTPPDPTPPDPTPPANDDDQPMTRREWRAWLAEQEAKGKETEKAPAPPKKEPDPPAPPTKEPEDDYPSGFFRPRRRKPRD